MLDRGDLYDAELVARLAGGVIPAPPLLFPQRGLHRSPRRGESLEFSEHTEYAAGDDLKHLDWKVFAKSDRFFVRRYEDERLARALFVVDGSGSMAYGAEEGSLRGSKYHLAAQVAVALAACLLRQGDAVGVTIAGEEAPFLPPARGTSQLEALIEVLGAHRPAGHARFPERCRDAGGRMGRSTALFAIGDFLDEEDVSVFGLLHARGVHARVVQVLHPDEVDLPFDQTTRFKDMEGDAQLVIDPQAVRKAYHEEIRAYVETLAAAVSAQGVPFALVRDALEAGRTLPRMIRSREAGR